MTSIEYESFLTEFFNEFRSFELGNFKQILKDSKAIIAGGSITRLFVVDKSKFKETDIDIYVNIKDSKALITEMKNHFGRIEEDYRSSCSYDSSFLVRNNIYRVLHFTKTISDKEIKVQIMLVRNSENVLNVVKNFDLTCCQCWYDGDTINVLHPDLMTAGRAMLNKEYFKCLINKNEFTLNRIKKYESRGFKILCEVDPDAINPEKKHNKINPKQFLQNTIFSFLEENPSYPTAIFNFNEEDDDYWPKFPVSERDSIEKEDELRYCYDPYDFHNVEDFKKINKEHSVNIILDMIESKANEYLRNAWNREYYNFWKQFKREIFEMY